MMTRRMKVSGVDWIGDIPSHWAVQRVKNYACITSGNYLNASDVESEGEYPVYGANGLRGYYARFNHSGVNAFTIGRVGTVGELNLLNSPTWVTDNALIATSLFSKWLYLWFSAYPLSRYASVTAQPLLTGYSVKTSPIAIPTFPEQKAIASFLDDRTTAIDSKIQLLEEKATALADLRKSVIHQAVTKGLYPNVAMKPSGVDWIGDVPAHWMLQRANKCFAKIKRGQEVATVLSLSYGQIITKKVSNDGLTPDNYDSYQGVTPNDIVLRLTDLQNDERSIRVAKSTLNGIITSAYLAVKTSSSVLPSFGYLLLHAAGDINKLFYSMGGGVRQTMKFDDLSRLMFALPTYEEQMAIVRHIDERTSLIDESIKTITEQIAALKSLRQSLIHEAVTGKIDVADYGYNYE